MPGSPGIGVLNTQTSWLFSSPAPLDISALTSRRTCWTDHAESLNLLVRARDEQEARERLWRSFQLHMDFPQFRKLPEFTHPDFSWRSDRARIRIGRG